MRIKKLPQFSFFTMMIVVLVILLWAANLRVSDYKKYHRLLAENATANVSESISQFIINRKRLMQILAKDNVDLIQQVLNKPENQTLAATLESKIKNYFPTFFSYTISDVDGNPYYDDFEGYVGDLCVADIKSYSKDKNNLPRIHPNSFSYHYDLMADFQIGKQHYVIFISFTADEIATYLKNSQAPGHKTVLVYKENQNLLEITTDGARNKYFREDYRLTDKELSYLLSEKPVPGSSWTVYDFYKDKLFSDFEEKMLVSALLVFLVFSFVSALFYSLVKKEEVKRKKAEAIKEEFVTIVSHELRTPLTSINGAIKLLENGHLGNTLDEMKPYINMASENIDRLSNLVNDILDVKKMESGEFDIIREKINLVDVVEQAITNVEPFASRFDANIDFDKPEKKYFVDADKLRLLQVFENLLSNAIKYGAESDTIKVNFLELGNSIRVNIEDHGEGIPEIHHETLFDKFTQAHSRKTDVVKGTGLGLNIAKTIIQFHGGEVNFESTINRGTVFYIILPLI
ncbi:MAG: HAMP domain-containing histidine kinase [Gammaproteobacteria bacterium]|nr:HAMP domain-containing histidine kinase [Gammaproteobacteria bacterium]MCW8986400.1 HAMP domain-containing histidine kinase [Gammaproteobacteria bacterium]MCW9030847.1 HAMP domain-containing histidine kinase [Gammaproteobacteria bacterium]